MCGSFFSGAGYNWLKRALKGFRLPVSMANSLSVLQTPPQTLWWIPLFLEFCSPNSRIWNKVPSIIRLLGCCHIEAHGIFPSPPCSLHPLTFCCCFAWNRALSPWAQKKQIYPSTQSSNAISYRKASLNFQFWVTATSCVTCVLYFIHHSIYHAYIYFFSNWIVNFWGQWWFLG